MYILYKAFSGLFQQRLCALKVDIAQPIVTQTNLLKQLLTIGKQTVYGQRFGYHQIKTPSAFREQVPLTTYEQFYPYIEQSLKGNQKVIWPTPIRWFAKSSGTTNDKSKFIPVSAEALQEGHFKAGRDMLALYLANYSNTKLLQGKSLTVGGSLRQAPFNMAPVTQYGDVSAIIIKNLPYWARMVSTPNLEIALLPNLEEKIEKLVRATGKQNITALLGVPTWVLLVVNAVLTHHHASHICQVWPHMEVFIHGGISFDPYKVLFSKLMPASMNYMEVYNASEGFFAIQDQRQNNSMLLLINHGVYYEFIPIEEIEKPHPTVLELAEVVLGKVYAVVITTNAGLWRYQIGDTVKFTSLAPYRIKIAGRTKHFINTFGEELSIYNAEAAITYACDVTGASINNYTAGPSYTTSQNSGYHEWMIEFVQLPGDINLFVAMLDQKLKSLNSDYEAKRYQNLVLDLPKVVALPQGTFYAWLKKHDKIGEQHKVPRLFNSRKYLDDIHTFLATNDYSDHR